MLVELARGADERQDRMDESLATLSNTMNELVKRMIALAEAQGQTDATVAELARGADTRFDSLDQTMATLSHSMNELAQRMITLSEAQERTEIRLNSMLDIVERNERNIN
jgi:phage I-like protein